jgi:hypothetical protein
MYTSVCIISEFQGKHVNGHSKDGECIIQNNLRHVWNIFTIWGWIFHPYMVLWLLIVIIVC